MLTQIWSATSTNLIDANHVCAQIKFLQEVRPNYKTYLSYNPATSSYRSIRSDVYEWFRCPLYSPAHAILANNPNSQNALCAFHRRQKNTLVFPRSPIHDPSSYCTTK
jgi:hypothetical protein